MIGKCHTTSQGLLFALCMNEVACVLCLTSDLAKRSWRSLQYMITLTKNMATRWQQREMNFNEIDFNLRPLPKSKGRNAIIFCMTHYHLHLHVTLYRETMFQA